MKSNLRTPAGTLWVFTLAAASVFACVSCGAHAPAASAPSLNHLGGSTSPYLLMHARNPVEWYPWGAEALERAKRENKPIFLSVGYAACHWCHVMAREDFENNEVADRLNHDFISIKVDREERPDIDSQYMTAAQLLTGSGGWPLSMWLTPDLKPITAGTYIPRRDFLDMLSRISTAWRDNRPNVIAQADLVSAKMGQIEQSFARSSARALPPAIDVSAFTAIERQEDMVHGGLGSAPKFPSEPKLLWLEELTEAKRQPAIDRFLRQTLDHMAGGGIFDQVGGGFHRYSTDEAWRVPHFEKMLYNQAQLAVIYLNAGKLYGDPRYIRVARSVLDFVQREMADGVRGGFTASINADSAGEEGSYYVWTTSELKRILGPAGGMAFASLYGASDAGNFGSTGANVLQGPTGGEAIWNATASSRALLLAARQKRQHPTIDNKIVTAWNGMMITAFSRGFAVTHEPSYRASAEKAAAYIVASHMRDDGSLVRASINGGRGSVDGFLDDYAFTAQGLLDLYAASRDDKWLAAARLVTTRMQALFWDGESGGFASRSAGGSRGTLRDVEDDPTQSPAGAAALVLARLAAVTAEKPATDERPLLLARAAATVQRYQSVIVRAPADFPTMLLVLERVRASTPKESEKKRAAL